MLAYKSGVHNRCYTAEQAREPSKVKNAVVLFAENYSERNYKACHTAIAVGNNAVPAYLLIAENLRKSVGENRSKQQEGNAF